MRIRLGVGSAGPAVPPKPRLVAYLPMSARAAPAQRGGAGKAAAQIVATLGLRAPNALAATLAMGASARARLRLSATMATAAFATASVRSTAGLTATLTISASATATSGSGARLSVTLATSASAKGNGTAGPRIATLLATGASAKGTSRTAGRIAATLATSASARGSGGAGFLNGHAYRRLMLVSPQPDLTDEALLTDFPLFIDSTEIPGDWSWLVSANGKLKSVSGSTAYDIRFHAFDGTAAGGTEQVGAQLAHDYESIDASTGTLRTFVCFPKLTVASGAYFWCYYGKAGLAASEENVSGTWTGATMVIDPFTGADLTGRGRTFAKVGTGTITSTTLDGRPAAITADQAAVSMRRTNADLSVFDGFGAAAKNGFTVEYWAKISTASSGNIDRLGGDPLSVQKNARFSGWAEHAGTAGAKPDVLQAGANWWNGSTQPNESTESKANIANATTRHMMVVRQSNTHTQMYDGETNVSSTDFANAPSAGTIHPQTGDNYSLFASTGTQDTAPAMTMGLYAVWPFGFSATRRGLADRTQRNSGSVVSIGAEDAFGDADRSPVGGVFRRTVTTTTDIDVLGSPTFDPDTAAHLTLTAVTNPDATVATCTLSAGKARIVPAAGANGSIEPVVTISDGTKSAKAKLILAISGVVSTGDYPDYALPSVPASAETRTVTNMTDLNSAIANVAVGSRILLNGGATGFVGNLTISRDVPVGGYITIAAVNHASLAGATASPGDLEKLTGNLALNGNGWIIKGLDFVANTATSSRITSNGCSRVRLSRFRLLNSKGDRDKVIDFGSAMTQVIVDRFTIDGYTANGVGVTRKGGDNDLTFSWFHITRGLGISLGDNSGHQPMFLGTDPTTNPYIQANCGMGLVESTPGNFELKGSKMVMDRLSLRNTSGFTNRHGYGNLFRAIYSNGTSLAGSGNGYIIRDIENVLLSCVSVNTTGVCCTVGSGNFDSSRTGGWWPGSPNKADIAGGASPRAPAIDTLIIDCTFDHGIILGTSESGTEHVKCQRTGIWKSTYSSLSQPDATGTSLNPGVFPAGYSHVDTQPLTAAGVGWNTPTHPGDGGAMPW